MAKPEPIYTPESVRVVHALRYDWSAWCRDGAFPESTCAAVESCRDTWAVDGLALDTFRIEDNTIQCLFDTAPTVSPAFCAMRAKGRMQHACRSARAPVSFSRQVSLRTLGENTRHVVTQYIAKQVRKSDYVDPRFKAFLGKFTLSDRATLLAEPQTTGHGRYWYNLHVVIVVEDRRFPMGRIETFETVHRLCPKIATKKGCELAELSVMPDHLHLSLRGHVEVSPLEIGLAFLNNLSFALGRNRVWSEEFYVGTFSEYDIQAIGGGAMRLAADNHRSTGTSPVVAYQDDWRKAPCWRSEDKNHGCQGHHGACPRGTMIAGEERRT